MLMNHADTYPFPSAPFCRSICKEGAIEILTQALLHFDDVPDSNIPDKTELFLEMKTAILGTLYNIITACPDNRDKYRNANLVDVLSKIHKTNMEVERISLMTLAYIVDEKENQMLVKSGDPVKSLTELFAKAVFSAKHMVESDEGIYQCRELLRGLNHLASHDTNKDAIVKVVSPSNRD